MSGHAPYFAALSAALKAAGIARPIAVVDAERLAANIARIRRGVEGLALRIAAKSLPAPSLLRGVMEGAGSSRLMVFNGTMLAEMAAFAPGADLLLGRPLPAAEAAPVIARGEQSPQWLIDTRQRLDQYLAIARAHGRPIRISLEIDVGLHRGGFADPAALASALDVALAEPLADIAGLMGYDAHAAGATDPQGAADAAMARYAAFVAALSAKTGRPPSDFTLNTAGTLTVRLHGRDAVANEVSVGSAFVKPTRYDAPSLADVEPAAFLAQPVLKITDPPLIPGREAEAQAIAAAEPGHARGVFLYGGYGDARPVSPAGLAWSRHWGGRGMLAGPADLDLAADDFVFLRPTESEGVLTDFGPIAVFDGQAISEFWPTFAPAG